MDVIAINSRWVRRMLGIMQGNPQILALANDMRVREAEILAAQICPPNGSQPQGIGQVVCVGLDAMDGALAKAQEDGLDDVALADVGRRAVTQLLVTAVLAGTVWGYIAGSVGLDGQEDDSEVEPGEIKIAPDPTIN